MKWQIAENNNSNPGFTIVELLVVIVVISILAAITIVSYTGISQKATIAALQSDLNSSSTQLKIYQAIYGSYPTNLDADKCPSAPNADESFCLKPSSNNTYDYVSDGTVFYLTESTPGGISYIVTDNQPPQITPMLNPAYWQTIGTQTWAKANLNVGMMVTGVTAQTNNGGTNTVEKYCYDDLESNCTIYGGLYQWDEAMQYATITGSQGICPINSHIPTDSEWTVLTTYLGSATAGTQLQPNGTSGLNIPSTGYRFTDGSFLAISSTGTLWSSSESSATNVWTRAVHPMNPSIGRSSPGKSYGFSVRCLGN